MSDIKVGDRVRYNSSGKHQVAPYRPSWMSRVMEVVDLFFDNSPDNAIVTVIDPKNPKNNAEELEVYLEKA